jgi:hypothetical protein
MKALHRLGDTAVSTQHVGKLRRRQERRIAWFVASRYNTAEWLGGAHTSTLLLLEMIVDRNS